MAGRARAQDAGGGYGDDEGPAYVDDDHQAISEFAAAFLDEDEQEGFVDHLMERRGYQRVQSWGPRQDPDPGADPGADPGDGGRGGSSRTRAPSSGGRGGGGGRGPARSGYFKR